MNCDGILFCFDNREKYVGNRQLGMRYHSARVEFHFVTSHRHSINYLKQVG